ncbi:YhgE/Pip domain-containing protein [Dietzia aurantiaca]|uniref:YhgE/Pip domain-containing protein n=1 Tax=Dietzia aurantiaca TaxID=983873 RepID=UPI001E566018|nr:YhgE/Pip domain-containing protein [Dietzia aurantiaca]MCD2263708.1 YhgE/Pip domain-containing protein [Dietzia aurantiaca]
MRNAFRVLGRDLTRIRRAPKSWAIIIGLLVLPSLYAWVNIVAFWDPYGNADHIKVAIVNQDEGASTELTGEVNVGEQVVEQLKTNDQLGWQFMDHDEAMESVRSGASYAAIVMPPDFSRDLLTITTGDFVQPELEYYTNEKANAIAPKITEVGASTLDTQINSNFVATVAKTIAEDAEQAGVDAGDRMINSRSETLSALDQALATVQSARMSMTELDSAIGPGVSAVADARRALERVDATIGDVTDAVDDAQGLVNEVQRDLVGFSETLTGAYVSGAANLTGATSRLQESIGQVSGGADTARSALTTAQRDVQAVIDANQALLGALRPLAAAFPPGAPLKGQMEQVIGQLEAQTVRDQELLGTLRAAQTTASTVTDQAAAASEAMSAVGRSSAALHGVMTGTFPGLNQSMSSLSASVGAFSSALDSQRVLVGEAVDMLTELESLLGETGTAVASLDGNLQDVQSDLQTLQTDLNAITAADIWDQVSALTSLDPDSIAGFMTGPVTVHENDLFPVPAYGSSMAPLFTNLSLWIAGFVLMVLFKLEVDTEDVEGLTVRQAYFGRWLLFAVMNLIQALLVSIGNVVIGVQTVNPVIYVATSVFIGLVYMSIIYALAVSFGYIGKGIAVLLVIMQIPGASGIYPIEMMPDFFRSLFPFFPFTYGIDAMRETIGGFYGLNYLRYMAVLALFAALAFALGIFLRQRLGNFARLFNKKLADTGLFLSEDVQILGSRRRLTQLVRALTDREKFRADNARRRRWMEMNRVNAKRAALVLGAIGTVVLFVVGSIFPDAKATVLGLWGLLCLLVMAAIVVVEYINQSIVYGTEVSDLPDDELKRALAEEEAAIRSDARLDQLEMRGQNA